MPRKLQGAPKAARRAAALAGSDTDASTQQQEPAKLNLYDSGALKGALDDCVREVVFDAGYDEDVSVSNVKITLGLLAMAAALYSQFGPGKFPDNWWTVFACVVVYVILTVILYLFSWRHEGDAFILTKPKKGHAYGLRLSSGLERYGEQYTLKITNGPDGRIERTGTWNVSGLFHEDGYLAEPVFREHVLRLLEQFEAAQQAGSSKKNN